MVPESRFTSTSMPSAVSIRSVSKNFGRTKALDCVDLEVRSGEILGMLGPNGAGKTTLISAMAGLVRPDSGEISVLGHDVRRSYRNARRSIGVVPQELVFDPFFTVRETLRLQSGYFGLSGNDAWIDHVLASLDLTSKANSNMRTLSGGMKRRVLVAQALVHKPPVIVLDEPTAGVDVELRQTLWQFVRELNQLGHTIVLTTHYLEEAEMLCDRIAMLKAGRIVALDTTQRLLSQYGSRVLRVRTRRPMAEPDEKSVTGNEGWQEFDFDNFGQIEMTLSTLRSNGVEILDMEIGKPDLESVFVRTMHSADPA